MNLINQTYDYIESFKWENSYTKDLNLNYNIPEINDFAAIQLKDTAIIEENEEFVIAHIPIMNIF